MRKNKIVLTLLTIFSIVGIAVSGYYLFNIFSNMTEPQVYTYDIRERNVYGEYFYADFYRDNNLFVEEVEKDIKKDTLGFLYERYRKEKTGKVYDSFYIKNNKFFYKKLGAPREYELDLTKLDDGVYRINALAKDNLDYREYLISWKDICSEDIYLIVRVCIGERDDALNNYIKVEGYKPKPKGGY